ncbi:hypothetical protein EJ06DRAFT_523603 [Trichodelitschia bisporula]|uniref:Uncharacterized protein n=1 Tax=Trichodelitschia bisporula TaxID=703511 RepID=A0A6G1HNU5_9PEZI|nr:hypothetical protein EJ06DRAFT_523603 [Trichodelitschia bisporula]
MAPIAPSSGTKVHPPSPLPSSNLTAQVSSNSPITEKPGFIAADSLAAESVRDHGAFSANPSTGISGQSAKGMTANTSDTSAASVRPPAPNAEARMQQHKERKEHDMAEEAAVREQDRIPEGGPVGGMGGEVKGNAKTAPTGMWRNVDPAVLKAKGKNLKEAAARIAYGMK